MANHLTPEELAKETGLTREDVIRICIEEADSAARRPTFSPTAASAWHRGPNASAPPL